MSVPPPAKKRPRPRPKAAGQHHHGDLSSALKESALSELESAPSFTHLSLRGIARRVGVSHVAAYRHYRDLDALLDALAVDGFCSLAPRLAPPSELAPRDAFIYLGQQYIVFAVEHPKLFSIMFGRGAVSSQRNADLAAAIREVLLRIDPVAKRLAPQLGWTSGRDLGLALWSFGHGLATLLTTGDIRSKSPVAVEAFALRLLRQLFPEPTQRA